MRIDRSAKEIVITLDNEEVKIVDWIWKVYGVNNFKKFIQSYLVSKARIKEQQEFIDGVNDSRSSAASRGEGNSNP